MQIKDEDLSTERCGCKYCGKVYPATKMKKHRTKGEMWYIYPTCIVCYGKNAELSRAKSLLENKNQLKADKKAIKDAFESTTKYLCYYCGASYGDPCRCVKCGSYRLEQQELLKLVV